MKSLQEILIINFHRISRERAIKQREVVKLGGISEGQLSKILNGEHSPKLDSVDRIIKGLGVKSWELFIDESADDVGPLDNDMKALIINLKKIPRDDDRKEILSAILNLVKKFKQ